LDSVTNCWQQINYFTLSFLFSQIESRLVNESRNESRLVNESRNQGRGNFISKCVFDSSYGFAALFIFIQSLLHSITSFDGFLRLSKNKRVYEPSVLHPVHWGLRGIQSVMPRNKSFASLLDALLFSGQ
jgi:hypothetical protein